MTSSRRRRLPLDVDDDLRRNLQEVARKESVAVGVVVELACRRFLLDYERCPRLVPLRVLRFRHRRGPLSKLERAAEADLLAALRRRVGRPARLESA